ncbi:MAG: hypothetical protein RE471_05720 [Ferroplasma sp.]|uniref:hypothetical protein n=1 Tax=Ferroplasma sp. TaxID=2591003 RepID=UPI002814DE49|nr:hypothetical protein [Ferroplasma sp.]WMT50479.1 MAG: hypothetical protein RE471_05720 [Ferroplasma sp.]
MEEGIQKVMNIVREIEEAAREEGNMETWNPEEVAWVWIDIMVPMIICMDTMDVIMKNIASGMNSTMDAMVAIR